jgi:hypothetical protein
VYVVVTVLQLTSIWNSYSSTEQFAFAKHLAVVLALAVGVCVWPKLGSLAAVVWGIFVPFERYLLLVRELRAGSLFDSGTFAGLDLVRLLLLALGTCLAGVVGCLILIHQRTRSSQAQNVDA